VRQIRIAEDIWPAEEEVVFDSASVISDDVRAERARVESKRLNKLYNTAVRQLAERDALADAFREAIIPLPQVQVYKRRVSREKAEGKHAAVALLSDIHAGEVVRSEAVGGLGGYDWDVFRQRLGRWTQTIIDLSESKRKEHSLDSLTVLMDGDMVSGEIHDDSARTNELSPIDACASTAQLLAHSLAQLGRHFDSVLISCTVGNHGRLDRKPRHKEAVERNWDWLTYQQTAQHLADQKHVTFDIPKAKWIVTPVLNERILHMHGDGIPSWLNFPRYGIDRVTKRMRETLIPAGMYFTVVCMGHFHTSEKMDTPAGPIYVNGSFPGMTEFSLGHMHTGTSPKQWLLTVHEKYGVIKGEEIFLDRATAEDAKGFPDALPAIWAEAQV